MVDLFLTPGQQASRLTAISEIPLIALIKK
jgi:hypothetical protein